MRKLILFLVLLPVSGLLCFVEASVYTEKDYVSENIFGTGYYCPKCNVELLPASKNKWVDSDENCDYCDGDGYIDGVDEKGNIKKDSVECPICHKSGKKQKLITIRYLFCPKCHAEYSYPK